MASKENKFAASEGGAMLNNKPTNQSSFNAQNLGKNSPPINQSRNVQQSSAPDGEDLNQEGAGGENVNPLGSPTDQAQKELVKKAGEAALTAAGAPQPVAKKLVDEAEKKGILDKINDMINQFKKKKMGMISSIVSAIMPIVFYIMMIMGVITMFMSILAGIGGFVEKIVDFMYGAVEFMSGLDRYQETLINELPREEFIKAAKDKGLSEEEAIQLLADLWASVLAPVNYKVSMIENPESELAHLVIGDKDWIAPCQAAMFLASSKADVCSLTFSGLSSTIDGVKTNYFNGNTTDSLTASIRQRNCKVLDNGFAEFEDLMVNIGTAVGCTTAVDEVFHGVGDAIDWIGRQFGGEKGWLSRAWESLGDGWVNFWTGQLTAPEHLESRLIDNISYKFDSETYANFLEKYYLDVRYRDLINGMVKVNSYTEAEARQEIIQNIVSFQGAYSKQFVDELKKKLNITSGSSGEEDITSSLGSVYGDNSCALLENYTPGIHEYTESQGVSNNEIHSISDGEVIYVKKDTKNLYEHWDSTKQKCICGGKKCEDYDGNEIKIKFILDDVEFIVTYSNLDNVNVNVGDLVNKGQVIATEGNTGCTNMKKLKLQLTSESGINYNIDNVLENCSSTSSTMNACSFNNIKINLVDCDNKLIKTLPLYDYVKEKLYLDFKNGIDQPELLKAGAITIVSNILANNDYKVGVNELTIKDCNYKYININSSDSLKLDQAISEINGQVITYNDKFISTRYNLTCNRTEKDENANSVYNIMCVNKALEIANSGKSYSDILKIYYPNYQLSENYCLTYASAINKYSLNNNKSYISTFDEIQLTKINEDLKSRINMVGYGTRAATVEAARYLTLGLEGKIPYQNGGKYFDVGINPNWSNSGLDSCGFVSWILLNGGANIKESLTISKLVKSPNISGNIKINSDLYKYYDKIQVGDFAYREDRIGIIIGKNAGVLYIAEANIKEGLIVTTISSYGESESNYTHIYFADNYYNGTGNVTSMW